MWLKRGAMTGGWSVMVLMGLMGLVSLSEATDECGCPSGTECRLMPGDDRFGLDFRCVAVDVATEVSLPSCRLF